MPTAARQVVGWQGLQRRVEGGRRAKTCCVNFDEVGRSLAARPPSAARNAGLRATSASRNVSAEDVADSRRERDEHRRRCRRRACAAHPFGRGLDGRGEQRVEVVLAAAAACAVDVVEALLAVLVAGAGARAHCAAAASPGVRDELVGEWRTARPRSTRSERDAGRPRGGRRGEPARGGAHGWSRPRPRRPWWPPRTWSARCTCGSGSCRSRRHWRSCRRRPRRARRLRQSQRRRVK